MGHFLFTTAQKKEHVNKQKGNKQVEGEREKKEAINRLFDAKNVN